MRLRIVRAPGELRHPDAVLIPGSKNTLADLGHLRGAGLADEIGRLAREGRTEVVGHLRWFPDARAGNPRPACSGIAPAESGGTGPVGNRDGLGGREDASCAPRPPTCASGLEVVGYEIHHGQTETGRSIPLFTRSDGQVVGAGSDDGRVWGTYLHGVFDADLFRRWFIDRLRVRRGLAPIGRVICRYDIEPALDRLADVVRRRLDMRAIYRFMGL